jgi:hypothetical protein
MNIDDQQNKPYIPALQFPVEQTGSDQMHAYLHVARVDVSKGKGIRTEKEIFTVIYVLDLESLKYGMG